MRKNAGRKAHFEYGFESESELNFENFYEDGFLFVFSSAFLWLTDGGAFVYANVENALFLSIAHCFVGSLHPSCDHFLASNKRLPH